MDFTRPLTALLAAGPMAMGLSLLFVLAYFALLFAALVNCLKRQPEKSRLAWAWIIILVPFGSMLYFVLPRQQLVPPPLPRRAPDLLPVYAARPHETGKFSAPKLDSMANHDEKKRAALISEALNAMGRSRRRS